MFSSFSLFKIQITVEVSHLACALLWHKWMILQLREDIIQAFLSVSIHTIMYMFYKFSRFNRNYRSQLLSSKKEITKICLYCIMIKSQGIFFYSQVLLWINQSFLLQDDIDAEGSLNVAFMSLRGSGPLFLKMEPQGLVKMHHLIVLIIL